MAAVGTTTCSFVILGVLPRGADLLADELLGELAVLKDLRVHEEVLALGLEREHRVHRVGRWRHVRELEVVLGELREERDGLGRELWVLNGPLRALTIREPHAHHVRLEEHVEERRRAQSEELYTS